MAEKISRADKNMENRSGEHMGQEMCVLGRSWGGHFKKIKIPIACQLYAVGAVATCDGWTLSRHSG